MTHDNNNFCNQLDDYVAGELTEQQRAAFEAHLADCVLCRQQIEQDRLVMGLLKEATEKLEPVPQQLVPEIAQALQKVTVRRKRRFAAIAATVAVSACLVLWALVDGFNFPPNLPGQPEPVDIAIDKGGVSDPKEKRNDFGPADEVAAINEIENENVVRVSFKPAADVIAVPLKSQNPNITIFWVYPTVKVASYQPDPETP